MVSSFVMFEKLQDKIKKAVRINLLLAIAAVFVFLFSLKSDAETIRKIYLNRSIPFETTLKFEKTSNLADCIGSTCFKTPNDIAIASDGSFFLIVDSANFDDSTIYLRKVFFGTNQEEVIPLLQSGLDIPLLTVKLSQSNKKAFIYREPVSTENTLVQVVDLTNNTVKELQSVTSKGTQIGIPVILDNEGNKILANTLSTTSPELITIDTNIDQIINRVPLPAVAKGISLSPTQNKAVITYKSPLGKTLSVYDTGTNILSDISIDSFISSSVGNFISRVDFDLAGSKAVLSSLSGSHTLHILDLTTNKLKTQILDKTSDGPTLSTITPDGTVAVSIGSILDAATGFRIYKTILSKDGGTALTNSSSFTDGSLVLDVDVTPDQSKILILSLLDEETKQLRILNLKDLAKITDLKIASDNAQSSLVLEPFGRYALTTNTNLEVSVSIIEDFNLGPIFKSISPNIAPANSATPFVINGFIDLTRFSDDVKVCFKSLDSCTSTAVSKSGQTISGITPKISQQGFSDLIIQAKSKIDSSLKASTYSEVFQFSKEAITTSDAIPPDITISTPKEGAIYNSRKVRVIGKVDGTSSKVQSVTVNGKKTNLSSETQASPNIITFDTDLILDNDGAAQITVVAKDASENENEKSVKITIDTLVPKITANVTSTGTGEFKVSGQINGTGSNVASILVNSQSIGFTEGELVSFSSITKTAPIKIVVSDKAGNKSELEVSNPLSGDTEPPVIQVTTPVNGEVILAKPKIQVTFTVSDNTSVKEVRLNGEVLTSTQGNAYTEEIFPVPGNNVIIIEAIDANNNKAISKVKFIYSSSEQEKPQAEDEIFSFEDFEGEKEIIELDPNFENLNTALIDQFIQVTTGSGELISISSAFSVEIVNPPPIPEGLPAEIKVPEIAGLVAVSTPSEPPEIPKDFSFATSVTISEDATENGEINEEELDNQNTTVLVDSVGRTFIVGFAFFKEADNIDNLSSRGLQHEYRFQTRDGKPLDLITTFTVPSDATEGDATVSILNKNQSLATISLKIAPSKDVKVGKRAIAKPQIKEPIIAKIIKSKKNLILKINGKNFITKVPVIDGKIAKLISKAKSTNVTLVPDEGIKIKKIKVVNSKTILVNAEIKSNIKPGIKLFNVVTPRGADIGAIVIPDPIKDGTLEATNTPENLILENN